MPAFTGLFGKPTIINNVETFAYVPIILLKGPEWFKAQGKNGCAGLKWVGIGGDVNKPGVFEICMGTTYTEVIAMAGGMRDGLPLKAFCPSGPTGGFVPAKMADYPMDFKIFGPKGEPVNEWAKAGGFAAVGSAAIVMLAQDRCLVDGRRITAVLPQLSCGNACRAGWAARRLRQSPALARAPRGRRISPRSTGFRTLDLTSTCGLGQVVSSPIQSVLKYFRQEVDDHLLKKSCPSGVCFQQRPMVENTNRQMSMGEEKPGR